MSHAQLLAGGLVYVYSAQRHQGEWGAGLSFSVWGKFVLLEQKSCMVGFCDLKLGEHKKSGQEKRKKGDREREWLEWGRRVLG